MPFRIPGSILLLALSHRVVKRDPSPVDCVQNNDSRNSSFV
jgi:hypothetical protein